ncbi:MAG: hypothetical protein ACRDNF_26170 [Streptosporangiaceae bacterium]
MSRERALAVYRELGWQAEEHDDGVELITGTTVDALEVPKTVGILAAAWWRYSEGYPDQVRKLPSLPDPRQALALITTEDRQFFLARAGECPWRTQDPVTSAVADRPHAAVIRWHSMGSRIPAPPCCPGPGTREPGGDQADEARAAWAHWPDLGVKLTSPAVLLHLLGQATATASLGPHMLALDHGALVIPAFGDRPAASADVSAASAPTVFGFSARG